MNDERPVGRPAPATGGGSSDAPATGEAGGAAAPERDGRDRTCRTCPDELEAIVPPSLERFLG